MSKGKQPEKRRKMLTWRMTRRRFIFNMGLLAVAGYGFGAETRWFDVTHKKVVMGKWGTARPLRILHMADMHASFFVSWKMLERAIALGLEQKPDLICLTGDFVTHKVNLEKYIPILEPMVKAAPTYASFGNHDGGMWAEELYEGYHNTDAVNGMLRKAGVMPLKNEMAVVEVGGQKVNLVGVGDLYNGEVKPHNAFAKIKTESAQLPTIVMSHNPDTKDFLLRWPWELLLCGHTHGGQIKIPIYGPIMVPIHDRRFAEGLILWNDRQVHVTRGVGNLLGFRFNCRPEISLLELTG